MRKILFCFLLFCVCALSDAQNSISGHITDQQNQPLAGVTVYLPESGRGIISDNQGYYEISDLPSGKLIIQFSFVGFNSEIRSFEFSGNVHICDIIMNPAVIKAQEVVISGGYISSQHENAVKIEVVGMNDILFSGKGVMGALTQIPGIDMIARGQGISKPVIRGLSMNNVLVLNNGVRVENYQYGENHPLGLDENEVEKVEIIKGPSSLMYGSDAIGGVLNFIREKPSPSGSISGDYFFQLHSNTLGLNQSFGIKGSSKKLFGGIHFGHKTHADYLQGGGIYVPNSRFNENSLKMNLGYAARTGTFKIFYDYFSQNLGMTVPPVLALLSEPERKNSIWYQDLEYQIISSQNTLFPGRFRIDIQASLQSALRKLITTSDVPFVEMRLNTFTWDSKLRFPSKPGKEYIIGIQAGRQNNQNLNNRASQFLPDADLVNAGLFGMTEYTFLETLKIQAGLRYDIYNTETYALGIEGTEEYHAPVNKSFSSISWSVGATYHPAEKLILRTNFARGFRVPNLSELTSNGLHGNRFEQGNANLNPQKSAETDASLHYHGLFLSFDAAGFLNNISDYIFIAPGSDSTASGIPIFSYRQTNAMLYGGEAGIHFHPRAIPWLHIQGTFSSVTGIQENRDFLPFIPAQKLRYEVRAERKKTGILLNSQFKISVLTAFPQNNPSPDETPTEGYTIIQLSFLTDISVFQQLLTTGITVNNIFDTQYIDHLSTLKEMGIYNQGRNVSLTLKFPFIIRQ